MSSLFWKFCPACLLVMIPLFLSSCATSSPPTRYYLLTSEPFAGVERTLSPKKGLQVISLGPVRIPPYLDRPQIVARISEHRLQLKNLDHWAEPFQTNLTRVLAQDLSSQFKTAQVVVFPEKGQSPASYRIPVQVKRFDADRSGAVVLHVAWTLLDQEKDRVLKRKDSVFRRDLETKDQERTVAAMSGLVRELSREIGAALEQIP
ncbi:MAG: PqiC family protein [Desulfohalobiaceae bacterium]|nr:PqiC family protein [Desulfohalobiaceae bacterium]